MATAPRPSYPSVTITPGAGDTGGGGGGLDATAVKALIGLRKTETNIDGEYTLVAADGIIHAYDTDSPYDLNLATVATYGGGRTFIINNHGTGPLNVVPANGNVFGPSGAPLSPPGYTIEAGASIILTTSAGTDLGWNVIYDSYLALLDNDTGGGGNGGEAGTAALVVRTTASEIGDVEDAVGNYAPYLPEGATVLVVAGQQTGNSGQSQWSGARVWTRTSEVSPDEGHDPYFLPGDELAIEANFGKYITVGVDAFSDRLSGPLHYWIGPNPLTQTFTPYVREEPVSQTVYAILSKMVNDPDEEVNANDLRTAVDARVAAGVGDAVAAAEAAQSAAETAQTGANNANEALAIVDVPLTIEYHFQFDNATWFVAFGGYGDPVLDGSGTMPHTNGTLVFDDGYMDHILLIDGAHTASNNGFWRYKGSSAPAERLDPTDLLTAWYGTPSGFTYGDLAALILGPVRVNFYDPKGNRPFTYYQWIAPSSIVDDPTVLVTVWPNSVGVRMPWTTPDDSDYYVPEWVTRVEAGSYGPQNVLLSGGDTMEPVFVRATSNDVTVTTATPDLLAVVPAGETAVFLWVNGWHVGGFLSTSALIGGHDGIPTMEAGYDNANFAPPSLDRAGNLVLTVTGDESPGDTFASFLFAEEWPGFISFQYSPGGAAAAAAAALYGPEAIVVESASAQSVWKFGATVPAPGVYSWDYAVSDRGTL